MNVLETEWWAMALPPEWWGEVDEDDDTVLVGDQDDVGCIEISTLHKDGGVFDQPELLRIARDESDAEQQWQQVELGDFRGWRAAFAEGDAAVREWYVASGSLLLFITYSCDLDNRGMDDSAVDELLDSLTTNRDSALS
jgi:hypothetical protein